MAVSPNKNYWRLYELYHQVLPTKLYHQDKTGTVTQSTVRSHLWGKCPESVTHVTSGLAPTKYLTRQNAALKILFFDMGLIEHARPWCSPTAPKPEYHKGQVKLVCTGNCSTICTNTEVRANWIGPRIVNKQTKEVQVIEMSCPWVQNVKQKHWEKPTKYAPLRWEISQQYPDYTISQYNIIIDVLKGYSSKQNIRSLLWTFEEHSNM